MSKISNKEKDNMKRRFDKALEDLSKVPGVNTVNGRIDFSDGANTYVETESRVSDGRYIVKSHAHRD